MNEAKKEKLEQNGYLVVSVAEFLDDQPGDWQEDRQKEDGHYLHRCAKCRKYFKGSASRDKCKYCA